MTGFDAIFDGAKVMVILRALPPDETVELAEKAWGLGDVAVEVPIGLPEQVASLIATVRAGAARNRPVGAGTVITREQVDAATRAGAAYTVAPGLDLAVHAASLAAGLPHLPGVATASEVQRAVRAGSRWVKVFPAITLGPSWYGAMHGPFPDLQIVATGGLTPADAHVHLDAGARMVGIGTAVSDPAHLAALVTLLGRAP